MHKLLVHPAAPDVLYQQNHVGVYRSKDHGTTWQRIDEGLPYDFGFGLALDPNDPNCCFVIPLEPQEYNFRATDGALRVYRSGKNGRGWKKLTKGLPGKNAYVSVLRQAMSSDSCDPRRYLLRDRRGPRVRECGRRRELGCRGVLPAARVLGDRGGARLSRASPTIVLRFPSMLGPIVGGDRLEVRASSVLEALEAAFESVPEPPLAPHPRVGGSAAAHPLHRERDESPARRGRRDDADRRG